MDQATYQDWRHAPVPLSDLSAREEYIPTGLFNIRPVPLFVSTTGAFLLAGFCVYLNGQKRANELGKRLYLEMARPVPEQGP